MNTNLIHNILNIAIAVVAAASTPEVIALFPPELAVKIVGALATAKLVINGLRDGIKGMVKEQPPVQ
jgi:hypothetical protein